jgi:hypothetical protein
MADSIPCAQSSLDSFFLFSSRRLSSSGAIEGHSPITRCKLTPHDRRLIAVITRDNDHQSLRIQPPGFPGFIHGRPGNLDVLWKSAASLTLSPLDRRRATEARCFDLFLGPGRISPDAWLIARVMSSASGPLHLANIDAAVHTSRCG